MPQTQHIEHHFTSGETVRDIVIGMADGLTVPFALAAGLSGAALAPSVVVTAGLAEIAAGAIAMGLGGYLAARSAAEHYRSEQRREEREVRQVPQVEAAEIFDILRDYGVSAEDAAPVVAALRRDRKAWVRFMMRFELGLEEPRPARAPVSALTIGSAYVVGGLIPLSPYMLLEDGGLALAVSVAATLLALAVFGYVKGRYTGTCPVQSAFQTAAIGSIAAAAAFGIARAVG